MKLQTIPSSHIAEIEADVLVVGLGPVGQLLALMLQRHGVSVLAIDRAPEPYPLPRAASVDDEVLRIAQSVGVDREIVEASIVQSAVSLVTADGRPVEVFSPRIGRLGHPPLITINQPAIERVLEAELAARPGVTVRRGVELEAIDRRADRVDAYLRPTGGTRPERVSARWLVGCDGGASTVRSRLQIPFLGRTAPERWVVVDALVDRPLARVPHPYFVGDPTRPTVTLPMSPGRHRWEWMLHPGEDPAPLLRPEAIQAGMRRWLEPGEHAEVERAVVYAFHTRVAARWRRGRVLLAGDAAHLMPPFAGQGLASGARDATNLSWKLAHVLRGAPDALLDSYEHERRPHVASMQRMAHRMGAALQSTSGPRVLARDTFLRALDGTRVQQLLAENQKPLPTYASGAFATRPHRLARRRTVGAWFPQSERLDDFMPAGWVALTSDPLVTARFAAAGLPVLDPGSGGAWLARRNLTFALLRPDRFVFAAGDATDVDAALAAWRSVTGLPATAGHDRSVAA